MREAGLRVWAESVASGLGRRLRFAATAVSVAFGVFAATGVAAYAVVRLIEPEAGGIHQGLAHEFRNAMTGGRYRVVLHCRLKHNTAGFLVHADSEIQARTSLEWSLPACEMVQFDGLGGFGPREVQGRGWYRGEFVCPANFHKRVVRLSAPDIDRAIAMASDGAAGCTVDFADQTSCPLLNRSCDRRSVDFRQANEMSAIRLLR